MKIVRLDVWSVKMPLEEPYRVAYGVFEETTNIFVRVVTDTSLCGHGCAAPEPAVTGESTEDVLAALRSTAEPIAAGRDPLRRAEILEALRPELRERPAALASVDMALFDLLGRKSGLPVWKLLGGYRECMLTSVTVGILPEAETVARARHWISRGFRSLKIKGGEDVEADVARVLKVRETVGPGVELRFDANQGFTVEQAVDFVRRARSADLSILEQPTASDEPDLLKLVTDEAPFRVMADESLVTLRDAFRMARDDLVDMMNLKLMKVGGLARALEICAVARSTGVESMVGCMDESALGIAAGLHLALSRKDITHADLDGHLGLVGDPTVGAVRIHDGVLYPADAPGFGVELRE